jgi:hypothetical protein
MMSDRGCEIANAIQRRRGWICSQAVTHDRDRSALREMLRAARDVLEPATVSVSCRSSTSASARCAYLANTGSLGSRAACPAFVLARASPLAAFERLLMSGTGGCRPCF